MAHSDISNSTLICSWLFTFLAATCIVIQVLHVKKRKAAGPDDYFIFLAFVISLLLVAQTTWAVVDEGQGVHEYELMNQSKVHFSVVAKSVFVNEILWGFVNTLLRVSALLLYRKIFGVTFRMRTVTGIGIFLSAALGIVLLLTSLLLCRPISAAWDPSSACNEIPSYVALEAIGLALDTGIVALPVVPVRSLHVSAKQQAQILLALSAGGLVVIVTALRLKALHLVSSTDLTYDKGYLSLLSNVGSLIGIIGCSGPAISVFLRLYYDKFVRHLAIQMRSVYVKATVLVKYILPRLFFQKSMSTDSSDRIHICCQCDDEQLGPEAGIHIEGPNCWVTEEALSVEEEAEKNICN